MLHSCVLNWWWWYRNVTLVEQQLVPSVSHCRICPVVRPRFRVRLSIYVFVCLAVVVFIVVRLFSGRQRRRPLRMHRQRFYQLRHSVSYSPNDSSRPTVFPLPPPTAVRPPRWTARRRRGVGCRQRNANTSSFTRHVAVSAADIPNDINLCNGSSVINASVIISIIKPLGSMSIQRSWAQRTSSEKQGVRKSIDFYHCQTKELKNFLGRGLTLPQTPLPLCTSLFTKMVASRDKKYIQSKIYNKQKRKQK